MRSLTSTSPALRGIGMLTTAAAAVTMLAPAASASVSSISFSTAGWKLLGQTTYGWGTAVGGAGSTVCTQVFTGTTWSTSQCTKANSTGYYSIPLTYGINKAGTYSFRAVSGGKVSAAATLQRRTSAPTSTTTSTSSTLKPADYYIKGRTTAGITLLKGYNGVKVYLVQKALGVATGTAPYQASMNTATINAVKAFQAKKGLTAAGNVDANTFYAIKDAAASTQRIKSYNFDVDVWKQSSTVASTAPRSEKVAAMVAWAKVQRASSLPYIWGGTGPFGYDCSGLMLQALRAGGYDPKNVSNGTNVVPPSKLSQAMYNDTEFPKADVKNPQFGDFIYYGGSTSSIGHVSMFVGKVPGLTGDQVVNAVNGKVQFTAFTSTLGWSAKVGANRMP